MADPDTAPDLPSPATADAPAAQAPDASRISLRAKGIIAFLALVLYVIAVAVVLADGRYKLLVTVEELEVTHRHEEALVQVNMAVAHAILTVNDNYFNNDPHGATQAITLDVDAVLSKLESLQFDFPDIEPNIIAIRKAHEHLIVTPERADIAALRRALHDLVFGLDAITRSERERKQRLLNGYRTAYDALTMEAIVLALLGLTVAGALGALFFSRLTWDLRKLEERALEIVHGYRDAPLEVTRGDEVGGLMTALNQMQRELREREAQLELSRQQQFHKEKMAALGSLAAALAHEINNPIAAIAGVAQSLCDNRQSEKCADMGSSCQPELILEQARRVSSITRQIADFTAPQSTEAQLLDLNGLVRSTCNFITFDRRFGSVELRTDLDGQLPAVHAVGDHLTQVLMNLLINAADALSDVRDRRPTIVVSTTHAGARVLLKVADNGHGMDDEVRARAFDEFFTTKPAGRGSGLGLSLCRSLIEQAGGNIRIDSEPGGGTTITVELPLDQPMQLAA